MAQKVQWNIAKKRTLGDRSDAQGGRHFSQRIQAIHEENFLSS